MMSGSSTLRRYVNSVQSPSNSRSAFGICFHCSARMGGVRSIPSSEIPLLFKYVRAFLMPLPEFVEEADQCDEDR